jgi:hypothetical protein
MITRSKAAMLVRNATTANGENFPAPMAALPKTGAKPRKNAESTAAFIPGFRPIRILRIPCALQMERRAFANPVVVHKTLHRSNRQSILSYK